MTDPVTIRYVTEDGKRVTVRLHQVGWGESWVLDLGYGPFEEPQWRHQHAIDGEPEVEVG